MASWIRRPILAGPSSSVSAGISSATCEGAVAPLREAYVQQQSGTGLFRSEATAELVIVLAELGQYEEAATIMREHPPDAIAIIPGLAAWAQSAVDAAAGHHSHATELAIGAARTAAAKGAAAMAMNFLTDAARYGDARQAAAVLPSLGLPLDTDLQRVRAADVLARARRDPEVLLDAADAQLAPASTGTPGSWPNWPEQPTATAPSSGVSPQSDGSRRIVWVPPPQGRRRPSPPARSPSARPRWPGSPAAACPTVRSPMTSYCRSAPCRATSPRPTANSASLRATNSAASCPDLRGRIRSKSAFSGGASRNRSAGARGGRRSGP